MKTIVTLKWGNRYGPEYVNRLYHAVSQNLAQPFRFVCFTDDTSSLHSAVETHPIPSIDLPPENISTGWRKLCLFQPGLPIKGPSLFLDLDLIIRGPLDPFFDFEPDRIPIIHNWISAAKIFKKRPDIGNSSVFRFLPNEHTFIWEQFHKEKDWALANFSPPQSYLTHCINPLKVYYPEEWTASFKRHCRPPFPFNYWQRPREPEKAAIVVFHGRPDPDEALKGYKGRKIHHTTRPATWLANYWSNE